MKLALSNSKGERLIEEEKKEEIKEIKEPLMSAHYRNNTVSEKFNAKK